MNCKIDFRAGLDSRHVEGAGVAKCQHDDWPSDKNGNEKTHESDGEKNIKIR
jgi:hypothetical protein